MKTRPLALTLFLLAATGVPALAAAPATAPGVPYASSRTGKYAIALSATAELAPARITLLWLPVAAPCEVFRRTSDEAAWTKLTATPLPVDVARFADTAVAAGIAYEYRVISTTRPAAHGFVSSGIALPAVEDRGRLLLLVEAEIGKALAPELAQLASDLAGDGWAVVRHDVARDLPVAKVKELIARVNGAAPRGLRALYLFGQIPTPYSGNLAPDGHPDHRGAWPADGFYADLDGAWTDASVSADVKSPRQRNMPGDGKFDQNAVPSALELEVGRVDLAGMTNFPSKTEIDLLRHYLAKAHAYRHKQRTYPPTAVIADNFGAFNGSAFAATGWRSFPPLVGAANVTELRPGDAAGFAAAVTGAGHTWVYCCGPGSYGSVGGVTTTDDFRKRAMRAPFWITFGSYFGDWAAADVVLRAPLAGSDGLANCWSGFPLWFFHPLATGQTLGHCARLSINNGGIGAPYPVNPGARGVHMALMGDPTLRMYPVAPATDLTARRAPGRVSLAWQASPDAVLGYHVYRAPTPAGPYTRATRQPVKATTFEDAQPVGPNGAYMVRAVLLETTPSALFYNLSQGVFDVPPARFAPPTTAPAQNGKG